MQHLLEVERGQEEPGEHRGGPEHADDLRDRDVAQREEAQRHQRVGDPRLADDEGDQQSEPTAEQDQGPGRVQPASLPPTIA